VLCDHAVGQFVEDHGSKEEHACENAKSPMLKNTPMRVFLRVLNGYGKRNEKKNNHPARMQIDGDTENSSNFPARSHGHFAAILRHLHPIYTTSHFLARQADNARYASLGPRRVNRYTNLNRVRPLSFAFSIRSVWSWRCPIERRATGGTL